MQDAYVGDIGDFGKYGLLRKFSDCEMSLAVNWYKVNPISPIKQNDGKYVEYLLKPEQYRGYDPELFDALTAIVYKESLRKVERVEQSRLLNATFFSEEIAEDRNLWHSLALEKTEAADIVFLDPDNGLETEKMYLTDNAKEKHVKWRELKDYYDRGQSVILYQHRPQMTKKDCCIKNILEFDKKHLNSDRVYALEFPKFTNRFYFFFVHEKHSGCINEICTSMAAEWRGFCNQLDIRKI